MDWAEEDRLVAALLDKGLTSRAASALVRSFRIRHRHFDGMPTIEQLLDVTTANLTRLPNCSGITVYDVAQWAESNGYDHRLVVKEQWRRGKKPKREMRRNVERDAEIIRRRAAGESLRKIAAATGLTFQRVDQICKGRKTT